MQITSVYSGPDGESHFKEVEIPTLKEGVNSRKSKPFEVKPISLKETSGREDRGYHTAPLRQYIVILKGELEIEIADGSKRIFRPGDILLAEDTRGHGHVSRTNNRVALIIPLE